MNVSFGWEAVARELPDAVAISEPGRDLTYAQFEDRSARLAAALTALELQQTVRTRLAGYKTPRIVVILPSLPRTPTGKLEISWAVKIARASEA